jgi:hypothetical protein
MSKDTETIIKTENGNRVSASEWDDGGVWLHLQLSGSTAYTALTRSEAEQLLAGLQAILAKEVTA